MVDTLHEKLIDAFDDMVIYKDLSKGSLVSSFKLPSFMRDWVIKKFQEEDGSIDIERMNSFIQTFIPKRNAWKEIKNRLVTQYEHVKFLGRISVNINIKTQEVSFELPDFHLSYHDTYIDPVTWGCCAQDLLRSEEAWGIIELGYMEPDEEQYGKIQLLSFQDFCPYSINLEEFKDARSLFTLDEWIDILLAAVDYNPHGYSNIDQKRAVLQRLLPFVEKNLNLLELAPPGTGKSYLFGQISRYGWLVSGKATRAQLIYNRANKRDGVVAFKDFVALDEIREAEYMKDTEMHSALQQIMENRMYKSDDGHEVNVDAGIVFLGNITGDNMNEYKFMLQELPIPFQKSPFLDRIHGFIKGWKLPRMNDDMKAKGWSLNTEYFTTIMHQLREDPSYRAIVEEMLVLPPKADTRDTEAIRRLCTGFMKLLFPHVTDASQLDPSEFQYYCLQPAKDMRSIIRMQMGFVDSNELGKNIPDIRTKGL